MALRKFLARPLGRAEVKATRSPDSSRHCPKGFVRCKLSYPQADGKPPVTTWELIPEREYRQKLEVVTA